MSATGSTLTAIRADVAGFVRELRTRPGRSGGNVVVLDSGAGLSNATLQQRLVPVRLFYDFLVEDGVRDSNPVGRGAYTPGRRFGGGDGPAAGAADRKQGGLGARQRPSRAPDSFGVAACPAQDGTVTVPHGEYRWKPARTTFRADHGGGVVEITNAASVKMGSPDDEISRTVASPTVVNPKVTGFGGGESACRRPG